MRLREPLSAGQAAIIVLGVAVILASQHWLGAMTSPLAWFFLTVVGEFVVQPVSTLIHEFGHAAAVVALGRGEAVAMVGRGPWVTIRFGRIAMRFSLLPTRGVRIAGVCRYDARGISWRHRGWIALAGPIATVVELVVVLGVAALLWNVGPFVRYLSVFSALGLISSLVVNLLPRGQSDSASVTQRDGWQARAAFARHRAGAPPPEMAAPSGSDASTSQDVPLPAHSAPTDPEKRRVLEDELRRALRPATPDEDPRERRRLEAQLRVALTPPEQTYRQLGAIDRQSDRARADTSVPPPGHPG